MTTSRAVIGCSERRDYSFPIPITALLWRRIGIEPIVFLNETEADWMTPPKRKQSTINALKHFGIDTRYVGHIDGYQENTIAQSVRQHACVLDFDPDWWLIPSDADLWPIDRRFYESHGTDGTVVLYYANGDHGTSFPTCHTAMQVKTWREVMGLQRTDDLAGAMDATFKAKLPTDGFRVWMFDQQNASDMIRRWPHYETKVIHINREGHPPKDRIDRCNWPVGVSINGMVDAHILRPADQPEFWGRIRMLLEQLLTADQVAWVDGYREEFIAGY